MMLPYESVESIGSSLTTLKADPDHIAELTKLLNDTLNLLENDTYDRMATIQHESFGTNSYATNLALHHGLAYQAMDETMQGIIADINAFAAHIKATAAAFAQADDDSEQAIKARHNALAALNDGRYGGARSAYDHARNHQSRNPFNPDGTLQGGDR